MNCRITALIKLSVVSISLVVISPVIFAVDFLNDDYSQPTGDGWLDANEPIFDEAAPDAWELKSGESLLGIQQLLKDRQYDAALDAAKELINKEPDNSDILALMGLAYSGKGEKAQAKDFFEKALKKSSGNINAALNLALMASQAGNIEEERGYYKQILKHHPDNQVALLMLHRLNLREQMRAKNYDAVLVTTQKLRSKQPNNPDNATIMGIAYLGKGEDSQAKTAFEDALKLAPGNPNAALNLALLAQQAGKSDEARSYYQQVLQYHPDHLTTLLMLAQLENQKGDKQAALALLENAVKLHPKAMQPLVAMARFQLEQGDVQTAQKTLSAVPVEYAEHPYLLETLGEVQLSSGDWEAAKRTLEKCLKLQPASAQAQYLLGGAYLAGKDRASATKALFKGLKMNPGLLAGAQLMTLLVSTEPKLTEKNKIVESLKKVQPEHPQVLDLEAQLALKNGEAPKAVSIYQKLHQRFPDTSVWVMALARAQQKAGDTGQSLKAMNDWLNDHPDDVSVRYGLATAYLQLNREEDAKAALIQVVDKAPDSVLALNNLAWLLRDTDPKQALAHAERAHELSPKAPPVLDTLGVLQLRHGDKVKALELLSEAQTLSPDDPMLAYHYSLALVENGKKDKALEKLSEIRNKPFPEQQKAQALYESLQ
ncbi:MAG: PEP-CTERM system TPR-repeat protein PrsT [Methylomicrobium sp.]|nr:PEP-CTERM system TPR-repeat protein PrsT [Methylomicrobium sp.]